MYIYVTFFLSRVSEYKFQLFYYLFFNESFCICTRAFLLNMCNTCTYVQHTHTHERSQINVCSSLFYIRLYLVIYVVYCCKECVRISAIFLSFSSLSNLHIAKIEKNCIIFLTIKYVLHVYVLVHNLQYSQ